ncbi:MAG: hypothetical protein Kow00107_11480 [Planctomycetota bacterium]
MNEDNGCLDRMFEGRDGHEMRKACEMLEDLSHELMDEEYALLVFRLATDNMSETSRFLGWSYTTTRTRWERLQGKLRVILERKGVSLGAIALYLIGGQLLA